MKTLTRLATMRIGQESVESRLVEWICYAAGPALLIVAIQALARAAPTRVEMLIGILAACGGAIGLVTMGLVLGVMAELRRR